MHENDNVKALVLSLEHMLCCAFHRVVLKNSKLLHMWWHIISFQWEK